MIKWLMCVLPNVNEKFFLPNHELISILNKKIQRLEILKCWELKKFLRKNYIYFSNVQENQIRFGFDKFYNKHKCNVHDIMKILRKFKKFKYFNYFFSIYFYGP